MADVSTNKQGYFGKGSASAEVTSNPPAGEGAVRRLARTKDRLVTQPLEGIDSIYDVVEYAAKTHGAKPGLGWRDIVKIVEEEKEVKKTVGGKEVTEMKKWKYFQLSDYKYHSYIEAKEIISEIARALVDMGVTQDSVFNVYAQTSVNWQLVSHGNMSISTTIATAYDTLGESGLTHSLNEPECVGLFTNAELLPSLLAVLGNTPTIRFIVYDGEPSSGVLDKLHAVREDLQILNLDQLREKGKVLGVEAIEARRPKGDTRACIMYTSGSTGPPKGVILTHSNLIASVGAVYELIGHHFTPTDTYLAYLPLAHILEYMVELCFYFVGMTTGFGRVKTLTDASVRNCSGDLTTFKPSIMVGVPAVWEMIRKGILSKVNSGGTLKKSVFNGAYAVKKANVPGLAQVADSVVLSNVKKATGGRLRLALSGGAALSRESQEFLTVALVTMLQGYGMTESCGMCAVLPPELFNFGSVGLPVPSIEIKLLDVADAGYLSTNDPPQGEVCIRGPSVTKGYYKRPDLNEDETIFTKDGWMRTGDVGQWNPDGTLTLIDRIKNLVKLEGGEYIALEKLESTYKACNLVSNICVHASPNAKQPIAIIIPNEAHLRPLLPSSVPSGSSLHDLCTNKDVRALILKECNAVGKKNGFKPMEILQAVVLTSEEWTPESGLVTAAQKIQRGKIAKEFKEEIDAAYK